MSIYNEVKFGKEAQDEIYEGAKIVANSFVLIIQYFLVFSLYTGQCSSAIGCTVWKTPTAS